MSTGTRLAGLLLLTTSLTFPAVSYAQSAEPQSEDALTAGRIRTAFADANPGWNASAIGVRLNRDGWLEEIRLCYNRRFRPTRCDANRFGARDTRPAKIWRGL